MNKETLKAAVIITAAGSSNRMGTGIKKEFLTLNNQAVLLMSVKPFIDSGLFSNFIIVLPVNEIVTGRKILLSLKEKANFLFISGGSTRQESVFNGLQALENAEPDIVLIHDGARPWISTTVIKEVYRIANLTNAAIPVVASVNAMKSINSAGIIVTDLEREYTVAAQTPQGFKYSKIFNSHKKAKQENLTCIDDAEIFGKYAGNVSTVSGDIANRKITYQSDMQSKKGPQ